MDYRERLTGQVTLVQSPEKAGGKIAIWMAVCRKNEPV